MFFFRIIYRRLTKNALSQIFQGRMKIRDKPEAGRFLQSDVRKIYDSAWVNIDRIRSESDLGIYPNLGNRHNVYLAIMTIGFYHALLDAGIDRNYAIELFADVGWKIYVKFISLPKRIVRIIISDPQLQMNMMLRMFMRFPFSPAGRPGYEGKGWAEEGQFLTHWTFCAPFHFVMQYSETHGDRGEADVFYRSWCWFDWPLAYAMVEGSGKPGYYTRPHTLSLGDEVCDMCWAAERPSKSGSVDLSAA
ncbi:MAG: hypothetical protein GTO18_17965 [Anaerolineales bacterium]|nr:hypothetical protein [Anaerolineales bacterium]